MRAPRPSLPDSRSISARRQPAICDHRLTPLSCNAAATAASMPRISCSRSGGTGSVTAASASAGGGAASIAGGAAPTDRSAAVADAGVEAAGLAAAPASSAACSIQFCREIWRPRSSAALIRRTSSCPHAAIVANVVTSCRASRSARLASMPRMRVRSSPRGAAGAAGAAAVSGGAVASIVLSLTLVRNVSEIVRVSISTIRSPSRAGAVAAGWCAS